MSQIFANPTWGMGKRTPSVVQWCLCSNLATLARLAPPIRWNGYMAKIDLDRKMYQTHVNDAPWKLQSNLECNDAWRFWFRVSWPKIWKLRTLTVFPSSSVFLINCARHTGVDRSIGENRLSILCVKMRVAYNAALKGPDNLKILLIMLHAGTDWKFHLLMQ